ncbi:MAG TPA: transcription antitermination factor NusB [Steroidobacteraceae bacterium]|nr:transcription antitermination factor NusB [Steroidobacteraceae bacterium]
MSSTRLMTRGRSVARKCAMQVLYQWQLTRHSADELLKQYLGSEELAAADAEYFSELVNECTSRKEEFDLAIAEHADRPVEQLDLVEHAILLIGFYELTSRLDVPYKVVINEAVDLSKRFGATDGHRYINAVLDKAARVKRAAEQGARVD